MSALGKVSQITNSSKYINITILMDKSLAKDTVSNLEVMLESTLLLNLMAVS